MKEVYILSSDNYFKIGISGYTPSRLISLNGYAKRHLGETFEIVTSKVCINYSSLERTLLTMASMDQYLQPLQETFPGSTEVFKKSIGWSLDHYLEVLQDLAQEVPEGYEVAVRETPLQKPLMKLL